MFRRLMIMSSIGLVMCIGPISAFHSQFQPARLDFSIGYMAVKDAVLLDVNRDGWIDVAGAMDNPDGNHSISILMNKGDGSFAEPVSFDTMHRPVCMAAADFNGDHYPDLAIASEDNILEIFLNQGDNTFENHALYSVAAGPAAVWTGHLNADNLPDIAVAARTGESVSVLLNSGGGSFMQSVEYSAPGLPFDIAGEDLDGDGDTDLALANTGVTSVTVLRNTGNGMFGNYVHYDSGGYSFSIDILDANSDGDPDLAAALTENDRIAILHNRGDGSFAPAVPYQAGVKPDAILSMDFNGDGRTDLAVASEDAETVSVLLNSEASPFTVMTPYHSVAPIRILAGDLNRDGTVDLAAAGNSGGTSPEAFPLALMAFFSGNGDGTFGDTPVFTGQDYYSSAASADFNGDSRDDLVFCVPDQNAISVYISDPAGGFYEPVSIAVGTNPADIVAADFNGDGLADLATANSGSDDVSIILGSGSDSFQAAVQFACGENPFRLAAGVFTDGDSVDLAVLQDGAEDTRAAGILENDGTAGFTYKGAVATGSDGLAFLGADLDGDHDSDMVALDYWGIRVMINQGEAGFSDPVPYGVLETAANEMASVDVDDDGDLDIAVPDLAGMIEMFLNEGDGTFGTYPPDTGGNTGSLPFGVVCADFDHDSYPDLAVASRTGDNVSVSFNSGSGSYDAVNHFYGIGREPFRMTGADVNGDGRQDLAVTYSGEPGFGLLLNAGDPPAVTPTPVPECTDTGVVVNMNAEVYSGGDPFLCTVTVCNSGHEALHEYPLFVLLECAGEYYFAPSFSRDPDCYLIDHPMFPVGVTEVSIAEFTWPELPEGGTAVWYAALTNPAVTAIYGEIDMQPFSW